VALGKSYGQFCGLARALDHIGDRWTLLVVRELIGGPRSFRGLQESLVGISPNLLVDRLRRLAAEGLAERSEAPSKSKHVSYALTEQGRALEAVVLELIRWGARYMSSGPGDDRVDPAWTVLALRALLEGPAPTRGRTATLHLEIDGHEITIRVDDDERHVETGHHGTPTARLVVAMPAILSVASGHRPWTDLTELVDGDAAALGETLSRSNTT
jgi:DNA-binding HxlR family transcriptional regulator